MSPKCTKIGKDWFEELKTPSRSGFEKSGTALHLKSRLMAIQRTLVITTVFVTKDFAVNRICCCKET